MTKQKVLEKQLYFPEVQKWMDEDREVEKPPALQSYPEPFMTSDADSAVVIGRVLDDVLFNLFYRDN